jgi:hypothetical protein
VALLSVISTIAIAGGVLQPSPARAQGAPHFPTSRAAIVNRTNLTVDGLQVRSGEAIVGIAINAPGCGEPDRAGGFPFAPITTFTWPDACVRPGTSLLLSVTSDSSAGPVPPLGDLTWLLDGQPVGSATPQQPQTPQIAARIGPGPAGIFVVAVGGSGFTADGTVTIYIVSPRGVTAIFATATDGTVYSNSTGQPTCDEASYVLAVDATTQEFSDVVVIGACSAARGVVPPPGNE